MYYNLPGKTTHLKLKINGGFQISKLMRVNEKKSLLLIWDKFKIKGSLKPLCLQKIFNQTFSFNLRVINFKLSQISHHYFVKKCFTSTYESEALFLVVCVPSMNKL